MFEIETVFVVIYYNCHYFFYY